MRTAWCTEPASTGVVASAAGSISQCRVWFCRLTSGLMSSPRSSRSASVSGARDPSARCVSSIAWTTSRMPSSPRSSSAMLRSLTHGRLPCRFRVSTAFRSPPSGLLISCARPEARRPRLPRRSSSASWPRSASRSAVARATLLKLRKSRLVSLLPGAIQLSGIGSTAPSAADSRWSVRTFIGATMRRTAIQPSAARKSVTAAFDATRVHITVRRSARNGEMSNSVWIAASSLRALIPAAPPLAPPCLPTSRGCGRQTEMSMSGLRTPGPSSSAS